MENTAEHVVTEKNYIVYSKQIYTTPFSQAK